MADATVERKTVGALANGLAYYISKDGPAQGKQTNVLNQYRSVNYNFTLAALRKSQLNNPTSVNLNNPDFVVVSSKGKRIGAGGGLSANVDPVTRTVSADSAVPNNSNSTNQVSNDKVPDTEKLNQQRAYDFGSDFINQFNQQSPGRFDMFIDDVDILSTFSFNEGTATTLPTEMNFEVVEPYSINGFMEALQAAAIGTGYTDYAACSFVMIIDFTGYPASYDIPNPISIPGASRAFMITIAEVVADITEKGTVYKVKAILTTGPMFGERVGALKRKLSAEGNTVEEFLTDFVNGINKQNLESEKSKGSSTGLYDKYEIIFPDFDDAGNPILGTVNKIGKAKYSIEKGSPNLARMQDIDRTSTAYRGRSTNASSRPEAQPTSASGTLMHTAQFDAGVPIQAVIASSIRDSDYVKDIVKSFMEAQGGAAAKVDPNGMVDYFVIVPKVTDQEGTINPSTNRPYKIYTYIVKTYKIIYNMALPGQGRQIIDAQKLKRLTLRNYNYFYTGLNTDVLDFKISYNTLFYEALPKALGNPPDRVVSTDKAAPTGTNNVKEKAQVPRVGSDSTSHTAPRDSNAAVNSQNPGDQPNAGPGGLEYYNQMVKTMHMAITNSGAGLITGQLKILGDPYYITAGGSGNNTAPGGKQGSYAGNGQASINAGQVLIGVNFNNPIDINRSSGLMRFEQRALPFSGIFQINSVRHKFKDGLFTQDLEIIRVPGQPQTSGQVPDELNAQFSSAPNLFDQPAGDTSPTNPGNRTTNDGTIVPATGAINLDEQGYINANVSTPGGLGGSSSPVFGARNPTGNSLSSIYGIIPNGVNQLATGIRASTQGLYDIQNKILGPAAQLNATARIFGSTAPIGLNAINNISTIASKADYALAQSITNPLLNASSRITSPINNIQNNVNNALYGALGSINRAFGINASGITGLTGLLSSRLLTALSNSPIPQNVNVAVASSQGLLIDRLPTLANVPATTTRPLPFNNAGFIGGNPVTLSTANKNFDNPLASQNYLPSGFDYTIQSGKLGSSVAMFNQTTNQSASVEGLKLSVNSAVGLKPTGLGTSVNNLYGSISGQNTVSPLVNALNNPNNIA